MVISYKKLELKRKLMNFIEILKLQLMKGEEFKLIILDNHSKLKRQFLQFIKQQKKPLK